MISLFIFSNSTKEKYIFMSGELQPCFKWYFPSWISNVFILYVCKVIGTHCFVSVLFVCCLLLIMKKRIPARKHWWEFHISQKVLDGQIHVIILKPQMFYLLDNHLSVCVIYIGNGIHLAIQQSLWERLWQGLHGGKSENVDISTRFRFKSKPSLLPDRRIHWPRHGISTRNRPWRAAQTCKDAASLLS